MKIRTVKDLKGYLDKNKLSPEKLCQVIKISNMTIRRLLKNPSGHKIPEKYEPHFDRLPPVLRVR